VHGSDRHFVVEGEDGGRAVVSIEEARRGCSPAWYLPVADLGEMLLGLEARACECGMMALSAFFCRCPARRAGDDPDRPVPQP
jgi:hypothetical protein